MIYNFNQFNESAKYPRWKNPKETLHHIISRDDRDEMTSPSKSEPFTEMEIDYLKSKLYTIDIELNKDKTSISIDQDKDYFLINKIQDEWYIVTLYPDSIHARYYKCDQFDGLIQCLKKIMKDEKISLYKDYKSIKLRPKSYNNFYNSNTDSAPASQQRQGWPFTAWYMR